MKVKLPLKLLAYLAATLPAIAGAVPAPNDDADVSIDQSVTYQLTSDTEYNEAMFQVAPTLSQQSLDVSFEGDGSQNLTLDKTGGESKFAQFRFIQSGEQSSQVDQFSLSFSQLKELRLGGTYGAVELGGGNGSYLLSIDNIGGNVSMDGNVIEYGSNAADALVSLHSAGDNTISISNIKGTLSISDNTKSEGRGQSGVGLLIYGNNKTGRADNLIRIQQVQKGIDVRNNTFSSGQGVIAVFNDVKEGSAVIDVNDISEGIRFIGNKGSYSFGACFSVGCKVNWSDGLFSGDTAITLSNIRGDILFQDNSSFAGSAFFVNGTESSLSIAGVDGNVSFIGNHADAFGGAIYFETGSVSGNNILSIRQVNGDVLFENNSATQLGGAICSSAPTEDEFGAPSGPANARIILSADGGDVVFQHNVMFNGGATPIANAILADGEHLVELGAAAGRRIAFYDPVVIQDEENASSVHFNKDEAHRGEILFSGRDYLDSDNPDNYTSTVTGDAVQHGGIVHLEQRAGLNVVNYVQEGGELMMGRRTSLTASGNVSLKTLTLDLTREGEGASIVAAGTISADQLAVYGSSSDIVAGETALTIKADSFGGILLESGGHEVAMRDSEGMSLLLGMNWALNDEGHLVFSVGDVIERGVIAELRGGNVANSMLSSASNLRALSDTTLGHVEPSRFLSPLRSNVWTSGLGDFNMQRTKGGLEGFDYQGGGFAVGGDYRIGREWLIGVAYGELFGKNISREFHATNKQNSMMGLVYGGWRHALRDRQALTVTGAFGFGSTDNDLSSVTAGGQNSSGSWRNRTFNGVIRAAWDIPLESGWVITPHVGVEYTASTQGAFTERGEMARRFDRGHYRNMSLPAGVTLQKTFSLGGRPWSNAVTLEYLPDVYRHQADNVGRLLSNGYTWSGEGSKPARQGVRATVSSRWELSDSWNAYCSYRVEGRDSYVGQTVVAGVGYSF